MVFFQVICGYPGNWVEVFPRSWWLMAFSRRPLPAKRVAPMVVLDGVRLYATHLQEKSSLNHALSMLRRVPRGNPRGGCVGPRAMPELHSLHHPGK